MQLLFTKQSKESDASTPTLPIYKNLKKKTMGFFIVDLVRHCIFSETAGTNDVIFKFKTAETGCSYRFFVKETPHKRTFALVNSLKGSVRLARSLPGILTWRKDNTARITAVLIQRRNNVRINIITIKFIILRKGWADGMLANIIRSVPKIAKPSNPFRRTSRNYPIYKKLHSIMMRGTRRSTTTSLAECKFRGAYDLLVKRILKKLQGNYNYFQLTLCEKSLQDVAATESLREHNWATQRYN